MMDNVVLEVKDLTKRFKIFKNPLQRLAEWFLLGRKKFHFEIQALSSISFSLAKGEFLGLIGPNGAGKSTLLKIITGVMTETSGKFKLNGLVLSLLDLGGGMDPAMTGRDNIRRLGELIGLPSDYVQTRIEDIVEFSELGKFIDYPIRIYSKGMTMRLAFSIFAFIGCDILILDEVLAVGDIFFRQKCFDRLEDLINQGTSILLATHNMTAVHRYCKRVMVLNKGKMEYLGEPSEGIRTYYKIQGDMPPGLLREMNDLEQAIEDELGDREEIFDKKISDWPPDSSFTHHVFKSLSQVENLKLLRAAICDKEGNPASTFKQGEWMYLYYEIAVSKDIQNPVAQIEISDEYNLIIHSKNTKQLHVPVPKSVKNGNRIRISQSIKLDLKPAYYVMSFHLYSDPRVGFENKFDRESLHIFEHQIRLKPWAKITVIERYGEDVEIVHGGICNLPGESRFEVL